MKGHGPLSTLVRALTLSIMLTGLFAVNQQTANAQGKTKQTTTDIIQQSSGVSRPTWCYFPTASTTDGRMISIVGQNLQSMAGDKVEFGIGLPQSQDSLRLGIFDGETSGLWDLGSTALTFTLYADSACDGTGTTQLGSWSGSTMTDNGWWSVAVAKSLAAKTSDTIYFYRVVVQLSDTTTKTWSNFKIRTNGAAAILPRAFAFAAPLFTTSDAQVIYPSYPSTATTTYDGNWKFYMTIPYPVEELELWDGDMDYGSYDGSIKDTDDVDTPNQLPSWCTSSVAVAEGVSTSNDYIIEGGVRSTTTKMTGQPADDNANSWYRRSPAVKYTVVDPDSVVYANNNPSGNLEWERFRLSTILTSASDYDYYASTLPRGTYTVNLTGMDLGNLNAWRAWFSLLGSTDTTVVTDTNASNPRNTEGPSTTNVRFIPVFNGVDSAGTPVPVLIPTTSTTSGTGTWGWWRSNAGAWPVSVITVGGISYTKSGAIALMGSSGNDLCRKLARELIAAKLNVMAGNESECITAAIAAGDAWLAVYPIGTTSPNTTTGNPIYDTLKKYNGGQSDCATGNGSIN
jgi:hypothetical protein